MQLNVERLHNCHIIRKNLNVGAVTEKGEIRGQSFKYWPLTTQQLRQLMMSSLSLGEGVFIWRCVKGGDRARAPLIAIPIISLLYDVPTAVAAFTIPNFYPMFGKVGNFAATKSPACLLWHLRALACLGQQLEPPG